MLKTAKLSSCGQIKLPVVAIKEKLGVEHSESVTFLVKGEEVKMTNIKNFNISAKDKRNEATVQKENDSGQTKN